MQEIQELRRLRTIIEKKEELEKSFQTVIKEKEELEQEEREQKVRHQKEKADVERLERNGITSLFYQAIGKKEQKQQKEQNEERIAREDYELVVEELNRVCFQVGQLEEELKQVEQAEQSFENLWAAVLQAKRAENTEQGRTIDTLAAHVEENQANKIEICEAVEIGEEVLGLITMIQEKLTSAKDWGQLDCFTSGGFSGMWKYGSLDEAKELLEELKAKLERFHTELLDTNTTSNLVIEYDESDRFFDIWCDNIFSDYQFIEQVDSMIGNTEQLHEQIEKIMEHLKLQGTQIDKDLNHFARQLFGEILGD